MPDLEGREVRCHEAEPERQKGVAQAIEAAPAFVRLAFGDGHPALDQVQVLEDGQVARRGAAFHTCGLNDFIEPRLALGNRLEQSKVVAGFLEFLLGHEFITDVLELRFNGALAPAGDMNLGLSTLYALLEGASETLGIPCDDLDGTLFPYQGGEPPALVLFDNVPGGAGHVRRRAQRLQDVAQAARERVARCECGRPKVRKRSRALATRLNYWAEYDS